jgi:hypothetical protein
MLTPEKFWIQAAQWGSDMRDGDPGSCLYTFDERGLVQSEPHRAQCIAWLDGRCRSAAALKEDLVADNAMIDELLADHRAAPLTPWTMPGRETR